MSKSYLFLQYATGRSDTASGYNFHRSSDSGVHIMDWMRGKTRASTIADEVPTREIKPNLGDDGVGDFVLVESHHVSSRYTLEGDTMYKEKCRSYDYSHYLIMPAPEEGVGDSDRPRIALEMMACPEYFLDVWNYQIISEDDKAPFEDLHINDTDLQRAWKETINALQYNGKLTGENRAAFLARYWEACWNILIGKEIDPLVVIATSPERNTETSGEAVILDGAVFFHDQVLPHLPDAVKQMLCVSFGCLVEQNAAQTGTACRICYPEPDAIRNPVAYRVFQDQVSDPNVDRVHLWLGEAMMKDELPKPYQELGELKNGFAIQQDFDLIYLLADFQLLMEDLNKSTTSQERESLIGDCTKGFDQIVETLRAYNLTDEEITRVLYSYELQVAKLCCKTSVEDNTSLKDYNRELYENWLQKYETVNERSAMLTDREKEAVLLGWKNVLIQRFKTVRWEDFPLLLLCNGKVDSWKEEVILAILDNKQSYETELDEDNEETFRQLLQYEQKAQIENYPELAEQLLNFILANVNQSETLLSPIQYIDLLDKKKILPEEQKARIRTDVDRLVRRHIDLCPKRSTDDLRAELNIQEALCDCAEKSALELDQEQQTDWFFELEEMVPRYYAVPESGVVHSFDEVLYESILQRAISLPRRSVSLAPEKKDVLNKTYDDCLIRTYQDEDEDHSPLASVIKNIGKGTDKWESELINKAIKEKSIPCSYSVAVEQLVSRRDDQNQPLGDLWLELLQTNYGNETMVSPDAVIQYIDQIRNNTAMSADRIATLKADIKALIMLHLQTRKAYPMQGTEDAMAELAGLDRLQKRAEQSALRMDRDQMTALVPEAEAFVPQWYTESSLSFDEKLYEAILEHAITLRERNGKLTAEQKEKLNQAYGNCLEKTWAGQNSERGALRSITKYDWGKTITWEPTIVQNAIDGATPPCEYTVAVDRLITLRRAKNQQLGDIWLELLKKSYSNSDDIMKYYMQQTGKDNLGEIEAVCVDYFQRDIAAMVMHTSIGMGSIQIRDIDAFNVWYNERNGSRNQELKNLMNTRFTEELQNRIALGRGQADLIRDYSGGADPKITEILLSQFKDVDINRILTEKDALEALSIYNTKVSDPEITRKFAEMIKETVNQSESLTTNDINSLIGIDEQFSLGNIREIIAAILEKTKHESISKETINNLCAYTEKHPESLETITKAMQSRMDDEETDSFERHAAEMLRFVQSSNMVENRKAACVSQITGQMGDKIKDAILSKELMEELLPTAKAAVGYQRIVLAHIMSFYDKAEEDRQFEQMAEFVPALDIRATDAIKRQNSAWPLYFLKKETGDFLTELKEQNYTLEKLLDRAEDSEGPVANLERLKKTVKEQNGAEEIISRSEASLIQQFRNVISNDKSLEDTGNLAEIIRRLNQCDQKATIVISIVNEAYDHIGGLLRDNQRFRELSNSPEAIRNLKRCMQDLNTEKDENLQEKNIAINNACRLFDFYDVIADKKSASGTEIHEEMTGLNLKGKEYVSDVCFSYGKERLQNCPVQEQLIPYLINSAESTGNGNRVQWEQFLNEARPLEQKGGWQKVNIWTADENAYGFLSMMLNWLGQEGLEEEEKQFKTFLNASEIGHKAHGGKQIAQIRKHYDERMKNKMLDWLLQDEQKANSEA